MNLVLIGYRGTGKSELGRMLSDRLKLPVVSLDAAIEREAGLSIPEIVAKHGWDWFRDLEARLVERESRRDDQILDTGGGAILRPENSAHLRQNGLVIWLTASPQEIVRRIQHSTARPSLTGNKSFLEEVEEVLLAREPAYRGAAHFIIDTENRTLAELADQIMQIWAQAHE